MVFFIPFMDKLSKKNILVRGTGLMGVCFFMLGLTTESGLIPLFVFLIFLYFALFSNSIGTVAWFYSSMVMSEKGLAFGIAMNWTTAGLVVFSFPFLLSRIGLAYSFFLLALMNIIASIYFGLDMIDSTGLSKQELRKVLSEMR